MSQDIPADPAPASLGSLLPVKSVTPIPRESRLVLRTAVFLGLGFLIVGGLVVLWTSREASRAFVELQITANRQLADRLATLLERWVDAGRRPGDILAEAQRVLASSTQDEAGFVCVMGADGTVLCRSDPNCLGAMAGSAPAVNESAAWKGTLAEWLGDRSEGDLLLGDPGVPGAQLVHSRPIRGTPWTLCVHSDYGRLLEGVRRLRWEAILLALPTGVLFVGVGTMAARAAVRGNERRIEEANRSLEDRVSERTRDAQRALHDLGKAQDALVRNEKLSFLGQLTASLAHELANPLTAVVGYSCLLEQSETDAGRRAHLAEIRAAGHRCSDLIQTFLAFARDRPPTLALMDLHSIVRRAARLLEGKMCSAGIELVLDLRSGLPRIYADSLRIEQAILNLVENSRQAMHEAGRRGKIVVFTGVVDGSVILRVADEGPGLPERIRAHLFEPFHTTRPEGRGTGLGLSICRRFIESQGGRLLLERTGPSGTVFRVEFRIPAGVRGGPQALEGAVSGVTL